MKFSTREILWIILAAALAIGWYADHRQLIHRVDSAEQQMVK